MKLTYRVFDPTGNITLLVATPVPPEQQPEVAARLMEIEPKAEQAGFLTQAADADAALRMAGGEFCGNASMCAAVAAAEALGTDSATLSVRVSGAEKPVQVAVQRQPDGIWHGSVEMPEPLSVTEQLLPGVGTVPVVRLPGITHIVLTEPMPRPLAERQAKVWCAQLEAEALGLMFLDLRRGRLTPLVYVPAADTLFWETSCASGTTAVGAYLAEQGGFQEASLQQPGGVLTVSYEAGRLRLSGTVKIGAEKQIDIE